MNTTIVGKFPQNIENDRPFKLISSGNNLPSISLNQLESELNVFKRKKFLNQTFSNFDGLNNKQFNVCSPFYDRMKTHKQNCKCPYHRKKRVQVLPVKINQKFAKFTHFSTEKQEYSGQSGPKFRFSNKQKLNQQSKCLLNNSFNQGQNKMYHTISQNFKPKIDSRNMSYEQFVKQCEYQMLRKKGFTIKKPSHIVRKGVRDIFQFINTHLEYTTDSMTSWINQAQKDKDYGEFYIERFKQMKLNYEKSLSRKKKNLQNAINKSSYSIRVKKLTTEKSKRKFKQLSEKQQKHQKTNKIQSQDQKQNSGKNQNCLNSNSKRSLVNIQRIIEEIQQKQKASKDLLLDIAQMDLESFKKLFSEIKKSIQNSKFGNLLLQKLQKSILIQIVTSGYLSGSKLNDRKEKVDIVSETHNLLENFRKRKPSHLSQRRSSMKSTSTKHLFNSKRNTQKDQNPKRNNSLHSKRSSLGQISLQQNSQTLIDTKYDDNFVTENKFGAILEQNQNDQQNSGNQQKVLKTLLNHLQNVRRSKLLQSEQMFKFADQQKDKCNSSLDEQSDPEHQLQKSVIEPHKGFFTKAEKYLYQLNMGKAIVKTDDSIFTAKRKVRVIKQLLQQNPSTSQAQELMNYIKSVEQRCFQKTQKDKRLNMKKRSSQYQEIQDHQISISLNIQNFGNNLIFYNLTSKIKFQDNEDLCILLNQMKLHQSKSLQNQVTYKHNLFFQSYEIQNKQSKKKSEDTLIQEQMRNMNFQPEIQSEKQQDVKNKSKRTAKSIRKSSHQIRTVAQDSALSGFYRQNEFGCFQDDSQDEEFDYSKQNEQQIRKALKYAKVHFPQTFLRCAKNINFFAEDSKQFHNAQ